MYLKKYLKKILICALLPAFAGPASAELFQYTDENGITRLTNNIYSVPAKDRQRLEPFSDFSPLTSDITIKPLEKKITPPPSVEPVIHPKTFKTQPYIAESIVPPPEKEIPLTEEAPKPVLAPLPSPMIGPEQSRQKPDTGKIVREPHKSRQAAIKKSAPDIEPDIKKEPVAKTPGPKITPQAKIPPVQTALKDDILKSEEKKPAPGPLPIIEKPITTADPADSAPPAQKEKPVKNSEPEPKPEPVQEADKRLPKETKPPVSAQKPELAIKTESPAPKLKTSAPPKPAAVIHKEPPPAADPGPEKNDVPETASAETSLKQYAAVDKQAIPAPSAMETPQPIPAAPEAATSDAPPGKTLMEPKQEPPLDLALLENTQKKLMEKKKTLNEKFQSLMREKQEIESSVDENDEESVLAYNERVKKLNIKIKEYNLEKKILQVQIEKYNHNIERLNAN